MRPRTRSLLALPLGGLSAALVACGGSTAGLIPAGADSTLKHDFDQIQADAQSGDCGGVSYWVQHANSHIAGLPSTVASSLRSQLQQGVNRLSALATSECQSAGSSTTASTTPASTTPAATTSTQTTTTQTTTTTATTPTTPTTPATPPSTLPGGGTPATTNTSTTTTTTTSAEQGSGPGGTGAPAGASQGPQGQGVVQGGGQGPAAIGAPGQIKKARLRFERWFRAHFGDLFR